MDEEGWSPILDVGVNVDWLTLDTKIFFQFFLFFYTMAYFMMSSHRKLPWAAILLHLELDPQWTS